MNVAPCRDCSERKYLCHSSCDKYIDFKKYKDNIAEKRKEEANAKNASIESVYRFYKSVKNGRTARRK